MELDRSFAENDIVVLRELTEPGSQLFTGRVVLADVGYPMRQAFSLPPNMVVFSLMSMRNLLNVTNVDEQDHRVRIEYHDGAINVATGRLRK